MPRSWLGPFGKSSRSIFRETEKDPRCQGFGLGEQSAYAVPLQTGRNLLGVLEVAADQPDGIRSVTRKLIDQVAIAGRSGA